MMTYKPIVLLISQTYYHRFSNDLTNIATKISNNGGSLEFIILLPSTPSNVGMENQKPTKKHGISKYDLNRITCAFASEDLQFNFGDMRRLFGVVLTAPNFQWLHISWIGIDFPLFNPVKTKNHCFITNAAGSNAKPIALSVLSAILAFNRGLDKWIRSTVTQTWANRQLWPRRHDIAKQKLLIYGFGAIGKELGRLAKGLDMYVIGVKRSITLTQEEIAQSECCDEIIPTHELSNRIETCDVVVITAPFNETTKNVFDKNMISNMKQNVIFINVGRGGIVDEMALAEALNTNQIAGCYCDVFAVEPLPSSHPLWQCENIIISPHDSASCVDNAFRVQDGFVDNLYRYGTGKTLQNVQWSPGTGGSGSKL